MKCLIKTTKFSMEILSEVREVQATVIKAFAQIHETFVTIIFYCTALN